jgi:hypothetical protein
MRRGEAKPTIGWVGGLAAFFTVFGPTRAAFSQTAGAATQSCVDAYEVGQQSRNAGDLLKARDDFRRCASAACPSLIVNDCTAWLAQVSEAVPSVVFTAKVDFESVFDVVVSADGVRVANQLDGKPVELNPGLHTFVFERAGQPPIEKKLIVPRHEVGLVVSASWQATPPAGASGSPTGVSPAAALSTTGREAPAPANRGPSTGRIVGWSVLGLGGAGVLVGSVFGLMMFGARDSAIAECPNNICRPGGLDEIRRARDDATTSTIAFSLGAGASVVAAYLLIRPEPAKSRSVVGSWTGGPTFSSRGAGVWIGATFE